MRNELFAATLLMLLSVSVIACTDTRFNLRQAPGLEVTKVVLYQNGVGYFERRGKIDGDELDLNVRYDQINDFLKSLAVIDKSEGRVVNVSLPLEENDMGRLASLPEQVRNAGGMMDVLRIFRGANVTVYGKKRISGRILGVEHLAPGAMPVSTVLKTSEPSPSGWCAIFMKRNGTLEVMPVEDIREIQIHEDALEVGLKKSLDISLGEGQWKPVALKIRLEGSSSHDLVLSYIVEMPKWKPSYRLVAGEDGRVLVQAWAVIDNVSGEDWNDVSLSLVSGSPLSFRYNLHSPRYINRVDLTPRDEGYAVAPPSDTAGYAMDTAEESMPAMAEMNAPAAAAFGRAGMGGEAKAKRLSTRSADKDKAYAAEDSFDYEGMRQAVAADVSTTELGSLFRYDIEGKVTVKDNNSTMVAIVNAQVPGREVWLFRRDNPYGNEDEKPYRAIRLRNDSGLTLEKGPVALYSKGSFVGEGFLERQENGADSFVSFAVDSKVSLKSNVTSSEEPLSLLKIQNGMIIAEMIQIKRSEYTLTSRATDDGTAYVRTAKLRDYSLRNPPESTVETPDSYYVPVSVPAGKSAKLKVELVSPVRRSISVDSNLSDSVLKLFASGGEIPANLKSSIDQLIETKARIRKLEEDNKRFKRSYRDYDTDQNRLRANLETLRKTHGNQQLVNELVAKLADIEKKLGVLSSDMIRNDEEIASLKARMEIIIQGISFESDKK